MSGADSLDFSHPSCKKFIYTTPLESFLVDRDYRKGTFLKELEINTKTK